VLLPDRRLVLATAGLLSVLATAACGWSTGASTGTAGKVAVTASDDACELTTTDLPAGTHTFTVTNQGSTITEFYVYATGDKVVAEVENIAPGVSRDVLAELPAGRYEAACKPGMTGDGLRTTLTVTGTSNSSADNPALAKAGAQYQAFVRTQTQELLARTGEFVAAIKKNDVARARQLYPTARLPWERIEPVAESFGDLDPLIDGREGDQEPGQAFTGFHRLEKALWQAKSLTGMAPIANQLLADVRTIAARANEVTLTPVRIATGAKALLDEIATGKITGEEDRYSHTDLWDFAGNLDGVAAAVTVLRPFLRGAEPTLLGQIDDRLAAVRTELGRHKDGAGWVSYDRLGDSDLHALSDRITALTESVSRVAAAVAER
jgi:iron uptake system component EfeO